MKNNFYLLLMFIVVGFTSCQKEPYATFQKAQSETFARTIKAKPVTVEAVQTPEVVNQVPASNITASSSDDISFEEPASVDLLSQIEVTPVEVVTVPVTTISRVSAPATTITHVSGKNKLLNKILAKKINADENHKEDEDWVVIDTYSGTECFVRNRNRYWCNYSNHWFAATATSNITLTVGI